MHRFRECVLAFLLILAPAGPALGQAPDTTAHVPPFFTYRDAVLLGVFGAGVLALNPLDRHLAQRLQEPNSQNNRLLHDASTFFRLMGQPAPQIIAIGLYGVGRIARNQRIERLAVHGTEAMLLSTTVTTTIKVLAGRARPRRDTTKALGFRLLRGLPKFLGGEGTEFQSFPSGHATTAFAVASASTAEFSHWIDEWHSPHMYKYLVGGVLFGGASLVGISRMYNNAHWASDVLAGAAIGTFAGIKTVRYNYQHPNNKVERWLVKVRVVPGRGSTSTVFSIGLDRGTLDSALDGPTPLP